MKSPCMAAAIDPSVVNLILANSCRFFASKISKVALHCEVALRMFMHRMPSSSTNECGLGTKMGSDTKMPVSFHVRMSLESTSTL